jgi:hypothetical protein
MLGALPAALAIAVLGLVHHHRLGLFIIIAAALMAHSWHMDDDSCQQGAL